jgi:hypothetical protein
MKLYIKNYSSYRSDKEDVVIKKELKKKYGYDTRRQDDFIHLAVYGGALLKQKTDICADDELYVTTGVGNVEVVKKTLTYMHENGESIKLFDFLNSVGNTTSYYISSLLGLSGKNIFQVSDNFTYINSLISIYASMINSGKNGILCSIDFVGSNGDILRRVLGVDESSEVVSSVNYQKFSLEQKEALAEVEFDAKSYSLDEVKAFLLSSNTLNIVASPRCDALDVKKQSCFFETIASFELNNSIEKKEDLIYIDCFKERYKILKLKSLR